MQILSASVAFAILNFISSIEARCVMHHAYGDRPNSPDGKAIDKVPEEGNSIIKTLVPAWNIIQDEISRNIAEDRVPVASAGGYLKLTLYQINEVASGTFKCKIEQTLNGSGEWEDLEVLNNQPRPKVWFDRWRLKRWNVVVRLPNNLNCQGSNSGHGNLCLVRCENNSINGPFGGGIPMQQWRDPKPEQDTAVPPQKHQNRKRYGYDEEEEPEKEPEKETEKEPEKETEKEPEKEEVEEKPDTPEVEPESKDTAGSEAELRIDDRFDIKGANDKAPKDKPSGSGGELRIDDRFDVKGVNDKAPKDKPSGSGGELRIDDRFDVKGVNDKAPKDKPSGSGGELRIDDRFDATGVNVKPPKEKPATTEEESDATYF
ncbi:hypothetical protein ABW20_dc0105721 [Dactylellina cionopaga]|nr:hypothetical protein ABW20_dc0105721 [Dactylellina cionopaga]